MILGGFVVSFWWRVHVANSQGDPGIQPTTGKIESCAGRNPGAWRWCAGVCAAGGGCVRVRGAQESVVAAALGGGRCLQAGQPWLGACDVALRCTDLLGPWNPGLSDGPQWLGEKKIGRRRAALAGPGAVLGGSAVRCGVQVSACGGRSVSNLTTNIREIWSFQSRTPDTPG